MPYSTLQLPLCHSLLTHFQFIHMYNTIVHIHWLTCTSPIIPLVECWRWGKSTFSTRTDGWVLIRQQSNPDQSAFQISPPSPWSISKADPDGFKNWFNEKSGLTSIYGDPYPPSLIGNFNHTLFCLPTGLKFSRKKEKRKEKKHHKCNTVWEPWTVEKVREDSEACPKWNSKYNAYLTQIIRRPDS